VSILKTNILYRKESSFNLGSAETKLLYTLHWILLDAADECALQVADLDGKIDSSPYAYLFPVTAITVSLLSIQYKGGQVGYTPDFHPSGPDLTRG